MPQDLIFVENLDGHVLPGLDVLRELNLREGPLPERPAELVLPHPRPPHRAHPPPPRPQATRIPGSPSRPPQDRFLLQGFQTHDFTVFTAAPIAPWTGVGAGGTPMRGSQCGDGFGSMAF
ncbi:hypothetical protein BHE74_00045748 [Ensete ventricosum]|nr:hypothetical protein GW17_00020234 [Ensete ventricosum]RWW48199.1 hypothetical protein BHE74_00045748 [Ensete ventricosum]RZS03178.1 hypothetical protein BHM03_00033318 [Ensete ventricosum]